MVFPLSSAPIKARLPPREAINRDPKTATEVVSEKVFIIALTGNNPDVLQWVSSYTMEY